MIIDKKLQLTGASGQAVTASAATTDVTNVLVDIGGSDRLYMVFTNIGGATVATATSVQFSIQHCATEGGTYVSEVSSPAIAVASLTAGAQVVLPVPPGLNKFVRGYFTVGGSNATNATFSCVITDSYQRNVAMPDGVAALA